MSCDSEQEARIRFSNRKAPKTQRNTILVKFKATSPNYRLVSMAVIGITSLIQINSQRVSEGTILTVFHNDFGLQPKVLAS